MKKTKAVATLDQFPPLYVNVWFENGHVSKIDEHYYHDEKKAKQRNRVVAKKQAGVEVRRLVNWIQVTEAEK